MREFLLYVCSETLERDVSSIREQEIGEAVFGRPRGYDTNIDNIVRVNATGLRKRLEQYFAEEGAQEEMIVEIPRGSYTPVFRLRSVSVPTPQRLLSLQAAEAPRPVTPVSASQGAAFAFPFGWMAAAILLAGCVALFLQNRMLDKQLRRWSAEPALRAFWGEFFAEGKGTDIVVADTSFSLAQDLLQRPVSLSDYVNYSYKRLAESPTLSSDQRRDLSMVLDRNYGSIGDFRAAQQILALNSDPKSAALKFAREFTTADAKRDSLVLIGSRASNPWVSLFADKLNFDLEYDPVKRQGSVVNRVPRPGEQPLYFTPSDVASEKSGSQPTGYGVIAYLPDLSGKGKTLLLEGTDSQATAATGEFVTSEEPLAAFESRLPRGPIPSFEILLRTSQISGTPIRAEIVAYRIYAGGKVTSGPASSH